MKNIRLILLTILLVGLAALPAAAADYYVDISNPSPGDGSVGNPWKYLHTAAGYTGYIDGDVIHVAAGEYSPDNTEPDSPLVFSLPTGASILGAGVGATIINPGNSAAWGVGLRLNPCTGVTVSGMTITTVYEDAVYVDTGTNVTLSNLEACYSGEDSGIALYSGSGNIVSNCAAHNASSGIEVFLSSGNTIVNCDVYNNGGDGINVYSSADNTVTRCQVYGNPGFGILFYESGNSLAVSAISRNRVYNNSDGIGVVASSLPSAPDVFNNLVYVDSGAMNNGIVVRAEFGSTGSVAPRVYHNTIDGATAAGIAIERLDIAVASPDVQFNIVSNCGTGIWGSGTVTPTLDYNYFYADTVVYDGVVSGLNCQEVATSPYVGGLNFHLTAGTPCIDGTNGSPATIDLDGLARDGVPDAGCYEFTSFTPPPVTPGITVLPTAGLTTGEDGTSDTFIVALTTAPAYPVTIPLSSSDAGEGTVSPASLTFTPMNWYAPQTVTVKGVNDVLVDGDIAYTVLVGPAVSNDPGYNGLEAADVGVTNVDNDSVGIIVNPTAGLKTSQWGGSDTFTVVLNSLPTAPVNVSLSSSDTSAGLASPQALTFTPRNWNLPQTVTVTGQSSGVVGDVPYTIITAPAVSDDPDYNELDPDDVGVTNVDNLPPDQPLYVFPAPGQMFPPGGAITLQGSEFFDPEGDRHVESWWRIAPVGRNAFGCADYPAFFDHVSSTDLTTYSLPTQDLMPGVLYTWIVGYRDAGSGAFTWSDKQEKVKNTFMVGLLETVELPPVPPGSSTADFVMRCCGHYIPDNAGALAVIGDDLDGGYDSRFYRIGIYSLSGGGGYTEYPGFSLSPGTAFWVLARNGLTIDLTGIAVGTEADVDLRLQFNNDTGNGWNMIGPPNNRSYPWDSLVVVIYGPQNPCQPLFGPARIGDLPVDNPYIDTRLLTWGGQDYVETSMMMAGHGYWVKARQQDITLRFPADQQVGMKNPEVLLALALDKAKKEFRQLVSPAPALADDDSPPRPMAAIEADGESGTSSGGNCFIGMLRF